MSKVKTGKIHPRKPLSKQANKPNQPINQSTNIIGLGIVVLLGILIYSNSFDCSFHFDDHQNIVDNAKIRNISDAQAWWNFYPSRPLSMLTFVLNYQFGKYDVWGYHFVNLLIHLINSLLVWWLTLLIFPSPNMKNIELSKHKNSIAIITALLFVSHPLATQSVTYIVQRMAAMAALFYFLSLALFMKARIMDKGNSSKYLLFGSAFVSGVIALLSKENAYTLPFTIVVVEMFFFHTKKLAINFKDNRIRMLTIGIICFISIVVYKFSFTVLKPLAPSAVNDYRTITSTNYLLTQFSVIVKYIQLLFLPVNQNLDYDFPLSLSFFEMKTFLSFLLLLSLIILAVFLYKKNRILSFGIIWFFITIAIESSIIPIDDLIFEHRTYLPSFGFFLIIGSVIYLFLWDKYKSIAIAIFVLVIGTNSYFTYQRNKVWKDEFSLWSDVIAKTPNKARAYYHRGFAFDKEKKNNEAIQDYSKAIEIEPNFFEALNNRGNIYKAEDKIDMALEDYTKAIKIKPDYYAAYNNRGTILIKKNNFEEAILDFNKVIENKPDFAMAYANRAVAELKLNKTDNACSDFRKAAELGFKPALEMIDKFCHLK